MRNGLTRCADWAIIIAEVFFMHYADMHIHSIYSDGTLTPAEIVRRAQDNGVGLIAVCDHNAVQGAIEAEALAKAAGIGYVLGVEIDAIFENTDVHILCYGADFENPALADCIHRTRRLLDEMSTELLRRMMRDYPQLSMDEYAALAHDTRQGGWKMLQYMKIKGITPNLKAGFGFYDRYGVGYDSAGFDSIEAVVRAIHAGGGRAVLAHPGVSFSTEYLPEFEARVERAIDAGLDGVECHYVRHPAGIVRSLTAICERRDLMITAGSDCHGAFSHNEIGQTKTPISKLRLEGLRF